MKIHNTMLALLLCLSLPCFAAAPSSAVTEAAAQSEATATRFQNYTAQFNATIKSPAMQFATRYASRLTPQQVRNNAELTALGDSIYKLEKLYPRLYRVHQQYTVVRASYRQDPDANAAALIEAAAELNARLTDAEALLADITTQAEAVYTRYGVSASVEAQIAEHRRAVEAVLQSPAVQFTSGYIARVFPRPNSPLANQLASYSAARKSLNDATEALAQKEERLRNRAQLTADEINRLAAEIAQDIATAQAAAADVKSISEDLYARYGNSN